MRLPLPANIHEELDHQAHGCVVLKRLLIALDLTERDFEISQLRGPALRNMFDGRSDIESRAASLLHFLEALCERALFDSYGVAGKDLASAIDETGTPAGWYPVIVGYDSAPAPPEGVSLEPTLLARLDEEKRVSLSQGKLAEIKERLRLLYEVSSRNSTDSDESRESGEEDDGEEIEQGEVSGTRILSGGYTNRESLAEARDPSNLSLLAAPRVARERGRRLQAGTPTLRQRSFHSDCPQNARSSMAAAD